MKLSFFSSPYKKILNELRRFGRAWSESKVGTYSSATAYYTVFSMAPLLIITIALASIFLDRDFVMEGITNEFESAFGEKSARLVTTLIQTRESRETNIFFAIIGSVTLLLTATGIFSSLQSGLDAILQSLPNKTTKSRWAGVQRKLLSVGMVLSLGFLMLASLVISTLITVLSSYLTTYVSQAADDIARIVEMSVSFLLIWAFLTLMYRFLPSKKISMKKALIGGIICAALFSIGKFGIGMYLGSREVLTGYGPAGALVLVILWAYYLSQIFFFSALLVRLYVTPNEGKGILAFFGRL